MAKTEAKSIFFKVPSGLNAVKRMGVPKHHRHLLFDQVSSFGPFPEAIEF
jgi:hypothetical protein